MQRATVDAWVFAAKTYLAAMLALFLALAFDLDRPGWAVTTVFITCQPFSGSTSSKALYRFLGTLIGAAVSVLMIGTLVQAPVLLCVALAAWVSGCLYMSLQDRSPRSYVFMLAGYTVAFIAFPMVGEPLGIFEASASRVEEITLGVVCCTCVHSIILPNSIMRAIWDRIDGWLRDSRVWSATALQQVASEESPGTKSFARKAAGYPLELDILSSHLAFDTSSLRGAVPLLRALLFRLELLLPILVAIEDRLELLSKRGSSVHGDVNRYIGHLRSELTSNKPMLDFAALQTDLSNLERNSGPSDSWNDLILIGLFARLRELLHNLKTCYLLRQRLVKAEGSARTGKAYRRLHVRRHVDQGLAFLSSATAFVCILVGCTVWIETGWIDGASVPMIAAVACSFFAAQDSPLPSMAKFAKFALVAVVISLVYSCMLLPHANSFEMAALMLAPVFFGLGLLIAKPATSFIGMVVSTNLATLVGLNNVYVSDLATSLNSAIALMMGIALTAVIMGVMRARTPAWSVQRILKAARVDLIATIDESAAKHSDRQSREAFVHRMLDRVHLVLPRLSDTSLRGEAGAAALLSALRLGANVIDLHRLQVRVPHTFDREIHIINEQLTSFLKAQAESPELKPSDDLRQLLDTMLENVSRSVSEQRQALLLALSGIYIILFRESAVTRLS